MNTSDLAPTLTDNRLPSNALLGSVVFVDCPFCGADGSATFDPSGGMSPLGDPPTVQIIVRSMGGTFVGCNVCGAQGPTCATRGEAISKWQVRRMPNKAVIPTGPK